MSWPIATEVGHLVRRKSVLTLLAKYPNETRQGHDLAGLRDSLEQIDEHSCCRPALPSRCVVPVPDLHVGKGVLAVRGAAVPRQVEPIGPPLSQS